MAMDICPLTTIAESQGRNYIQLHTTTYNYNYIQLQLQLHTRLTLKGAPHFACHFAACILPLQIDPLSIRHACSGGLDCTPVLVLSNDLHGNQHNVIVSPYSVGKDRKG